MKNIENRSGRLGRRALFSLITVLVLVVTILLNLLVSVLGQEGIWQIDETVNRYTNDKMKHLTLYTPTKPFMQLIGDSAIPMVDKVNADRAEKGEEPITINIIFCADRDMVWGNDQMRYVLYTALKLEKEYKGHIKVDFININKNPSAVQKYKATSATRIYSSNVIFEFGTEYRVYSMTNFFVNNETSSEPWAYNGEKHFANAILAVTRAESPVACFLNNHGEGTSDIAAFRELVVKSGYVVQDLDLEKEEIPENCRLLICYDPQTDFYAFGNLGETGTSEIDKLDKYLDGCFSFMLFVDNKTPKLPNLEEYLEEWGVTIARGTTNAVEDNYTIRDTVSKLDKDGYIPLATYATAGLGASITSDMREVSYPAKVAFPNATAITMAKTYRNTYVAADETEGTEAYRFGTYYRNGVTRYFSDVFLAGNDAVAEVNGQQYEVTTTGNNFKLMTMTTEERVAQETNYFSQQDRSFLCVFGSTEFASDTILTSDAYGNADVLMASLRAMGREVAPAKLDIIAFKNYEMDLEAAAAGGLNVTTGGLIATVVCFAAIPALIFFGLGIYVTVRRKYR
ncbi:MAG: Gldg family protein [Clostridia bacterium]|nr:Gldg family protein [Clostridia bacterium]